MSALEQLDKLISTLDQSAPTVAPGGDALDEVRAAAPRKTALRSAEAEQVLGQFRQELTDGLIRVDTVGRLLELLHLAVGLLVSGRA